MEFLNEALSLALALIDFILHIDIHLKQLCLDYGPWVNLILFLIVFCETGLVVTPFLPGDSLLFAVGSMAALGALDVAVVTPLLIMAAVLGDGVNYAIGARVGPKVFQSDESRFFKKAHLFNTQEFYNRHGGKTIIIARFMPIIRTFAPFVAGIGTMSYLRFFAFNVIGAVAWVVSFVLLGYFFGNIPVVKKNFTLVIFAIIVISILPGVIEYAKHRRARAA
jgi:membrane-associated protein